MVKLSFKNKLFALTFCAIGACAIAIVALTMTEHARLVKLNSTADLTALSQNTAEDLLQYLALESPDELAITSAILKFERYSHIKSTQVYDHEFNLVAQFINPQAFTGLVKLPKTRTKAELNPGIVQHDNETTTITLIGDDKFELGYLVVVLDFSEQLSASEQQFYNQLIPLVIIVLVLTFILVHWLQSDLIRPLLSLSQIVDRVRNTSDYSLRFGHRGSDEIAQLGANFNEMLSTIDQQNKLTVAHNLALEKQQKSLEYLANYDQLTKLPNRKLFQELLKQELSRLRRDKTELAVMFIDLDDFKMVNDTLGHQVGDLLLHAVAIRLQEQLRDCDILARLGGDEFVIVTTGLVNEIQAITVAERILKEFKAAFSIEKWQVGSGLSIGIAFSDGDKIDLTSLISNADLAMYRAKNSGRGCYAIYEDEMQSNQHRRLNIVNELETALAKDEFELYYQPKVCPYRGVVGLEALIRWNSRFDGFISPAEFIPIAEHCGKVHDITCWVLTRGFAQIDMINQQAGLNLVCSFNISAHDITKKGFIDFIRNLLKQHQSIANQVEFEVTESSYIENFDTAHAFFEEIEKLNCNIALDDFGTGYSSLSYLTQIKADILKIDQQFVRKMFESERERLIVDAIINLAKNLKLKICAEGVENIEQYQYLSDLGCDQIQGYYFSPPVPFDKVLETIDNIHQKHQFDVLVNVEDK